MTTFTYKTLPLLLLAAGLTACGQGPNVGTETTAGTQVNTSRDSTRTMSQSLSADTQKSTRMPAATVVQSAFAALPGNLPGYIKYVHSGGHPLHFHMSLNSELAAEIRQAYRVNPAVSDAQIVTALNAALAVRAAGYPQRLPAVKGEEIDMYSGARTFPEPQLSRWALGVVGVAKVAGFTVDFVAKKAGGTLENRDVLEQKLREMLFQIPADKLAEIAAVDDAEIAGLVVDKSQFAMPLEVSLPAVGWNLKQDQSGLMVIASGAKLLSMTEGYAAGQRVELAMNNTAKNDMSMSQVGKGSTTVSAGSTNKSGVSVAPGN